MQEIVQGATDDVDNIRGKAIYVSRDYVNDDRSASFINIISTPGNSSKLHVEFLDLRASFSHFTFRGGHRPRRGMLVKREITKPHRDR